MQDISQAVRSLLPGRLRLRHRVLCALDESARETVLAALNGIQGVTGVTMNPRVGSVLLTWDVEQTDSDAVMAELQALGEMMAAMYAASQDTDGEAAAAATAAEGTTPAACLTKTVAAGAGSLMEDLCDQPIVQTVVEKVKSFAQWLKDLLVKAEKAFERCVADAMAKVKGTTGDKPKSARREALLIVNRALTVTLILTVLGLWYWPSGLHVIAGTLYIGLTLVHMWQNRRLL